MNWNYEIISQNNDMKVKIYNIKIQNYELKFFNYEIKS